MAEQRTPPANAPQAHAPGSNGAAASAGPTAPIGVAAGAGQAAVGSPPTSVGPGQPSGASALGAPQGPPLVATRPRAGPVRRVILLLLALVALVGSGVVGYRWWDDSIHFVSTDNAQVAGRLIQVGPLAAGRVSTVPFDVGARVARDQVVATLHAPMPVGVTSSGAPRLEFRETEDALVEVRSPINGLVVARGANPGDTVPAGQSLLTVVDPRQLWINANVEETQIRRVRPGQRVLIHVDALDAELAGRVVAITPASAATFSLLPQQNLSGNFTRQIQLVPVKIELETPEPSLMIGTSVSVKIRVLD